MGFYDEINAKLLEPFDAGDVDWRVGSNGTSSNGKPWAKLFAYITNRAIMYRLDQVVGAGNWRNEFAQWNLPGMKPGVMCGLSIRDPSNGEWVTKYDGAEVTDVDPVKGGFSDAMKRAAVQWGIGRYLYDLGESWAEDVTQGKGDPNRFRYTQQKFKDGNYYNFNPPRLPRWALPSAKPQTADPRPEGEIRIGSVPAVEHAGDIDTCPGPEKPIISRETGDSAPKSSPVKAREGGAHQPPPPTPQAAPPAKPPVTTQSEGEIMTRVNKAIAMVNLTGTVAELQKLSDVCDRLVASGDFRFYHRDLVNEAIRRQMDRIRERAASPFNPGVGA